MSYVIYFSHYQLLVDYFCFPPSQQQHTSRQDFLIYLSYLSTYQPILESGCLYYLQNIGREGKSVPQVYLSTEVSI